MRQKIKHLLIGVVVGVLISSTSNILAAGDGVLARFTSFNFIVNGESKTLDTQPLVYNNTSYLPVRAISNMLGYDVTFKADSNTIELNKNGQENETVQNNNQSQTNNESDVQYTKMNFGETYEKAGVKVSLDYKQVDTSSWSELELLTHPEYKNNPKKIIIKIELDNNTVLNGSLWNMQLITDNLKYNSTEGKLMRNADGRIDYGKTYETHQILSDTDQYKIIGVKFYIQSKNIYLEYEF